MFDFLLIVLGLVNLFSKVKEKDNKKRKKKRIQEYRETNIEKRDFNNPGNFQRQSQKKYGLGNILDEVQKALEEAENKSKGIKDPNRAKEIVTKKVSNNNPFKKNKPNYQVLEVEDRTESARLQAQTLGAEKLDEYERSLYGDDEDNPMFDYNLIESDDILDEQLDDFFEDLISDNGKTLNLREGIIFKEILDKPLSMRR